MKKVIKYVIIPIMGICLASALVFQFIFRVSLPKYDGKIELPGLIGDVDVYTDNYGAPHVFAQNELDLFYSSGFLMARERLFQMSLSAATGRGELSAFLGDDLLSSDIYLRTFGIPNVAQKLISDIDDKTLKFIQTYCNGINDWIDQSKDNWPVEFLIIGSDPIKWTPQDVVALGRLMAYDLQQSWRVEIVMGALVEKYGETKVKSLFPNNPDDITIVPPQAKFGLIFDRISKEEKKLRLLLNMDGSVMGSNSWVVSGDRTKSGKPILANDPHLGTKQPSWWYEMHLKGGRLNISGVCLPGMPLPIIGQNEHVAWGFTNVMIDDMDFFVETLNPDNLKYYKHGNDWREISYRKETIPLKSRGDTTIIVRSTHHGPIISDIHSLLKGSDKVVSMAWVGHYQSEEISTLIKMAKIRDWDDFSLAVKSFSVPGQNIVYADKRGNIGWRPAVRVPIRKDGQNLLPRPGHDPDYDWKGFVPFEEMPFLFNPEKGYIGTANNKMVDESFSHYISNQWASPSRIKRIEELIESSNSIDIDFVKKMHMDQKSHIAKEITDFFLKAKTGTETGNLSKAFGLLSNWDFIESENSAAALVYHFGLNSLLRNLYGDELNQLGEDYLENFVNQPMVPVRSLLALLRDGKSDWFDDITTNKKESMDDILKASISDAVENIEKTIGSNTDEWKWSAVHTLTHNHTLGVVKILDKVFSFNVGPYPAGGSAGTINKGEYILLSNYDKTIGPSMRRIVDFDNLNNTQFILPTGQSGIPTSPHYKDQAPMYNKGEYRTTYFDEDFIRSASQFRHLKLVPGE